MITANQAREIAGPTTQESIDEHLAVIEEKIKKAASDKKRQIILRRYPFGNWAYNMGKSGDVGEGVFEALRKAGFEISTYYRESQFVDVGLTIKW